MVQIQEDFNDTKESLLGLTKKYGLDGGKEYAQAVENLMLSLSVERQWVRVDKVQEIVNHVFQNAYYCPNTNRIVYPNFSDILDSPSWSYCHTCNGNGHIPLSEFLEKQYKKAGYVDGYADCEKCIYRGSRVEKEDCTSGQAYNCTYLNHIIHNFKCKCVGFQPK